MTTSKKKPEIKGLYYITHIENLRSILSQGILSHRYVEDHDVKYKAIYDVEIVGNRKSKTTPDGRSLWEFANVYFQPRNPMLYRVAHEKGLDEIVVLGLYPRVLEIPGAYITNGNAANNATSFFGYKDGINAVTQIWGIINSEWWNSLDGSKRKIMAECLVPGIIPPDLIHTVYVASHKVADAVRAMVSSRKLSIIPEPTMFFIPAKRYQITHNLSLAEGDMFFSNMQTLTVSVNTVGIMGKGLASRAKYQFPDVYVVYQDACRKKLLKMGKPYLYQREASFDDELIDEPGNLTTPNSIKWFLLFATKHHWRENSDIGGIEKGLRWLAVNYEAEGIKSIALPALGCGLGNLDWKDVGPMMCQHLAQLKIPVAIYLPRERQIPQEFLSGQYLLAGKTSHT
jgi:O-acetyl-ADP-ribose deacetylase (regulator of RNase III)